MFIMPVLLVFYYINIVYHKNANYHSIYHLYMYDFAIIYMFWKKKNLYSIMKDTHSLKQYVMIIAEILRIKIIEIMI